MTSQSPSTDLPVPAVALAIGAHPDDIEFGCGATLAKWAASGCEVHHLVCTDGSKGSWDPEQDTAELVALRRVEQRRASILLGGKGRVTFLGWPDGELQAGQQQRWEVAYHIRRVRPEVVLGHDPWRRYRLHPDHRNAGFLVTDGIVAARDPHFFPELAAPPHRPSTLLLWEAEEPDHIEDVSAYVDAKLAALMAHRSQLRSTMGIDAGNATASDGPYELPDDPSVAAATEAFVSRVKARLAAMGTRAGFVAGEGFKAMREL